jgi:8-oxo-dGTP pyrophosphatase MutT (NUDIX family)
VTERPPITIQLLVTPRLAVRLAACTLAVDAARGVVLLTRRPRTMRTFPGAWVTPGGGVDDEDASVAAAALRELNEETGLDGSNPELLCAWESAYPPTADGWSDARDTGGRTAHHLIMFYVVQCESTTPLALQPDECDAACWVPIANFAAPSTDAAAPKGVGSAAADAALTYDQAPGVLACDRPIASHLIHGGVYPTADGEGVGRGHLFALAQHALGVRATVSANRL